MLVSLIGRRALGRSGALSLFRVSPHKWKGTSCEGISAALRVALPSVPLSWRHGRPANAEALVGFCTSGDRLPVLVSAWCFHRRYRLLCGHAFLVTERDANGMRLLDPLCKRPQDGTVWNAHVLADDSAPYARVLGSEWQIDLRREVSVLAQGGHS